MKNDVMLEFCGRYEADMSFWFDKAGFIKDCFVAQRCLVAGCGTGRVGRALACDKVGRITDYDVVV